MSTTIQQLQAVVEEARKRGARGVEAYQIVATGGELSMGQTGVAQGPTLDRQELTVRVWMEEGREGASGGTPRDADRLITAAIAAAEKADPDPFAGPIGRLQAASGGLGVDDPRHDRVERDDRIDVLMTAERATKGLDRRLLCEDFVYSDRREHRVFVNSKGAQLEEYATNYRASGRVIAVDGSTRVVLEGGIEGRSFASIASLPFGVTLGRLALALLEDGPTLSGPVRVMFGPQATGVIFARLAASMLPGRVGSDATFLRRLERDEPLFDARLHMVDDGSRPGGLRTRLFDDRGVPPVPLTLLREGRVDRELLDLRTARQRETRPTGHWHEGALRPSNLAMGSGTRSMNALLTEHSGEVLKVEHLADFDGLDEATGDVDMVVSGLWMQGSDTTGAVRDVRLRGNLLEVLNQVVDVASDTDRNGHIDAPGLLVDGFTAG